MIAETISVGTELLLGDTIDSNSAALGKVFAELGIDHFHRQTVGDNLDRLTNALRLALSRADVVVTIGGLGPTEDDLTRSGIANALGLELQKDPEVERHLIDLFQRRGIVWTESQLSQAMVPEGGEPIINPNGTAPALWVKQGHKIVVALPGPPREFVPFARGFFFERLKQLSGNDVLHSRTFRVVGIGEAAAEEKLRDLLADKPYTLAPYAKTGEVHFRASVKTDQAEIAKNLLDQAEQEIRNRLGKHVYSAIDQSFEETIVQLLAARNLKVSTCESCTGGGVLHRLTSVNGSSAVVAGGFVTYTNELKTLLAGVKPETLAAFGAVSEEVAREMAEGTRQRLNTDFAISVTGVAGLDSVEEPGGTKPSGLVYIGLATADGCFVERLQWGGSREIIRARAVQHALYMLYRSLS